MWTFIKSSSEFAGDLIDHFIDVLPCFGTDFNVLTAFGFGGFVCVSDFFVVALVSYHNDWTCGTRLLDFFPPHIDVIDAALVAQIYKHQNLATFPVKFVSDLCEVQFATEVPKCDMNLTAIFCQEVLVVILHSQSRLIVIGAVICKIFGQEWWFTCLLIAH